MTTTIVFEATNPRNYNQSATAFSVKDALTEHLRLFRSKNISVLEYRNGCNVAVIGGDATEEQYYSKKFSRAEAQQFIS